MSTDIETKPAKKIPEDLSDAPSPEFCDAFFGNEQPEDEVRCSCGRLHVFCACYDRRFEWDDDENDVDRKQYAEHVRELEERKAAGERLELHYEERVWFGRIDCRDFVIGCPCNGLSRYEQWINSLRAEIETYFFKSLESRLVSGIDLEAMQKRAEWTKLAVERTQTFNKIAEGYVRNRKTLDESMQRCNDLRKTLAEFAEIKSPTELPACPDLAQIQADVSQQIGELVRRIEKMKQITQGRENLGKVFDEFKKLKAIIDAPQRLIRIEELDGISNGETVDGPA